MTLLICLNQEHMNILTNYHHIMSLSTETYHYSSVSQKSPISLIEQSNIRGVTTRQCPELRKLLFYTAREAIMVCRERTKNIITKYPLFSL